jgi:hypothetical protein
METVQLSLGVSSPSTESIEDEIEPDETLRVRFAELVEYLSLNEINDNESGRNSVKIADETWSDFTKLTQIYNLEVN